MSLEIKSVREAVMKWGDHWSISQEIGPLGGTSSNGDQKDYHLMRGLTGFHLGTREYVERRLNRRRQSD